LIVRLSLSMIAGGVRFGTPRRRALADRGADKDAAPDPEKHAARNSHGAPALPRRCSGAVPYRFAPSAGKQSKLTSMRCLQVQETDRDKGPA
jgi:hypothetical protein